MIRVLIADDHTLMRDGLQTILSLEENIEVVGSASNGEDALQLMGELRPDVVLMDIQMPGKNGISCSAQAKKLHPEIAVIILTTFAEEQYIIDSLNSGVSGFLLKDIAAEKLSQSIRDAASGQFILPTAIAAKLAARLSAVSATGHLKLDNVLKRPEAITLSEKEKSVAAQMLEGKTNREIAEQLYMSEGTIKNYVSAIYAKIGTNDRTIAVMTLRTLLGG